MQTTLEAIFDGTVLHLDRPLGLAPHTRVRVTIEVIDPVPEHGAYTFLHTARSLNLDAPADFATDLDTYVYGESDDAAA